MAIAAGSHLFPFRTEKLSPPAPMVLQQCGRVGRRQLTQGPVPEREPGFFLLSPQPTGSPPRSDAPRPDGLALPSPDGIFEAAPIQGIWRAQAFARAPIWVRQPEPCTQTYKHVARETARIIYLNAFCNKDCFKTTLVVVLKIELEQERFRYIIL